MTDPLSIVESVAGVISLGIQVTQSLIDFYKFQRYQNFELAGIIKRLENLTETLQSLEKALSGRTFQADERSLIKSIEKSFTDCDELIQKLQDECQKFNKISSTGMKAALKVVGRRVAYPFRQSTLQRDSRRWGTQQYHIPICFCQVFLVPILRIFQRLIVLQVCHICREYLDFEGQFMSQLLIRQLWTRNVQIPRLARDCGPPQTLFFQVLCSSFMRKVLKFLPSLHQGLWQSSANLLVKPSYSQCTPPVKTSASSLFSFYGHRVAYTSNIVRSIDASF